MDVSRKRLVAWRSSISTGAKIGGECSNPLRCSGWSVKYFLNEIDCLFLVDELRADQESYPGAARGLTVRFCDFRREYCSRVKNFVRQ